MQKPKFEYGEEVDYKGNTYIVEGTFSAKAGNAVMLSAFGTGIFYVISKQDSPNCIVIPESYISKKILKWICSYDSYNNPVYTAASKDKSLYRIECGVRLGKLAWILNQDGSSYGSLEQAKIAAEKMEQEKSVES